MKHARIIKELGFVQIPVLISILAVRLIFYLPSFKRLTHSFLVPWREQFVYKKHRKILKMTQAYMVD